jgi:hypothetical protein
MWKKPLPLQYKSGIATTGACKMPDFELPSRYLARNFAPEDRIAIVLIDRERNEIEQKLLLVEQVVADRFEAHLRASNAHGRDIFVSMNTMKTEARGRTKADVDVVRHLYLDLDSGGRPALDRILNAQELPAPHEVLESSPDKFQIHWRVQEFEAAQAEALMRQLARDYGADPAATDISRVLRLPGFRNWKYAAAHYVREVKPGGASHGFVYTPADFPRIEIETERTAIPTAGRAYDGKTGGSQSERDYAYALRHLERGDSPGDIRERMAAYRSGEKSNPAAYAERTVRNALIKFTLQRGDGISSSAEGEGREQSGLER